MDNTDLSALKIDRSNPSLKKKSLFPSIKYVLIGGAVLLCGFFLLNFVFFSSKEVKVTTVRLSQTSAPSSGLTASGYIIPQRKAAVASKATGRLVYLGVVEGDRIKKGDLIGKIENNDIRAEWLDAKATLSAMKATEKRNMAELKRLETDYRRMKNLFESGAISKSDFDDAETKYNVALAQKEVDQANVLSAEARMKVMEVQLNNTEIRAPFDGTILTKGADIGEIVAPFAGSVNAKSAVVTMADMSSLMLEADVSESSIQKVSIGQNCEIILDAYPQTRYPGVVDKIVPTANRSKATILCKIKFLDIDDKVLPEMSAKTTFLLKPIPNSLQTDKPKLMAPLEAILEQNDEKVVFKVIENHVKRQVVEIGQSLENDKIEIKSGINSGEKIVLNPDESLHDGDQVVIIP